MALESNFENPTDPTNIVTAIPYAIQSFNPADQSLPLRSRHLLILPPLWTWLATARFTARACGFAVEIDRI